MRIDIALLDEKLGIPVIGAAIGRKRGLGEMRQAIADYRPRAGDLRLRRRPGTGYRAHVAGLIRGDYRLERRSLALLLLQRDEELQARVRQGKVTPCCRDRGQVNAVVFERRESTCTSYQSWSARRSCKGLLDGVFVRSRGSGGPSPSGCRR